MLFVIKHKLLGISLLYNKSEGSIIRKTAEYFLKLYLIHSPNSYVLDMWLGYFYLDMWYMQDFIIKTVCTDEHFSNNRGYDVIEKGQQKWGLYRSLSTLNLTISTAPEKLSNIIRGNCKANYNTKQCKYRGLKNVFFAEDNLESNRPLSRHSL